MCEAIIQQAMSINKPEYRELVTNLYAQWETWDRDLFQRIFTIHGFQPLIQLVEIVAEQPDETNVLGRYQARNQSTDNQPRIFLSETILNGQAANVRNGSQHYNRRILCLNDILLHEMIHQFQHEIVYTPGAALSPEENKEWADAWEDENRKCGMCKILKSHGIIFTRKANQIAEILGLNQVGCECEPERLEIYVGRLSNYFPMCFRNPAPYEGAFEFGRV